MSVKGPIRLLTFDAFGTLFYPKAPVARQYDEVARRHGLTGFTEEDIDHSLQKGEVMAWSKWMFQGVVYADVWRLVGG